MENERMEAGMGADFHPGTQGFVLPDLRMARMVTGLYLMELESISSYAYRSLVTAGGDESTGDLFDEMALDEMRHFQLLGELILALGGNPIIRRSLRVEPAELIADGAFSSPGETVRMLFQSLREEKRAVERYRSVAGLTEDGVVRSILLHICSDEIVHIARLEAKAEELQDDREGSGTKRQRTESPLERQN